MDKTLAKIGGPSFVVGAIMVVAIAESKAPSATIGITGFALALIGGICLCLAFIFNDEAVVGL